MSDRMNDLVARLAALPELQPRAGGWQRVLQAQAQRGTVPGRQLSVALAATALFATVGLAWLAVQQGGQEGRPAFIESRLPQPWSEMQAENARLEELLRLLPERHSMRGATAFTVATLEDRLALVDEYLTATRLAPNAPEQAEHLWRERVDLMNSLVQVRYAAVTSPR